MVKTHPTCIIAPSIGLGIITIAKVASSSAVHAIMAVEGKTTDGMSVEDMHAAKALQRVWPEQARADGYFIAVFVRNPFDRLVSAWRNKIHKPHMPETRLLRLGFTEGATFPQFVSEAEQFGTDCDAHLLPQHRWLVRQRRLSADFIGRMERMEEDWERLRAMFPVLGPLEKLNATNGTDYRQHYDKKARIKAAKLYSLDCDFLGYDF